MAVFAPEMNLPVLQALDVRDHFAHVQRLQATLCAMPMAPDAASILAQLFSTLATMEAKFATFTTHRGLHIDSTTFLRWREKLAAANTLEQTYLARIAALEGALDGQAPNTPEGPTPECHVADDAMTKPADVPELHDLVAQVHASMRQLAEKDDEIRYLTTALKRPTTHETKPKPTRASGTQTDDPRRSRGRKDTTADTDARLVAELDAIRQLVDPSATMDAVWSQAVASGALATAVSVKQRVASYVSQHRTRRSFLADDAPTLKPRILHPPPLQALPQVQPRSKSALRRMPKVLPNQVSDIRPSDDPNMHLNLDAALRISKGPTFQTSRESSKQLLHTSRRTSEAMATGRRHHILINTVPSL
ncbi:hypothetical protein SDRG_10513 [Saprolegnia diclina VS20]|uniref:Uncharacterized protein n=1 Tax=Saprolegnia diclina (strain VS20) TaxID=1156394 RepID=T0QAL6_SAPDV|nr:hypothetical protein SDRG_10513 [Saprolegnia diclina VS20]EQC31721.1 hypothetical protein SDRG_10513 [Saprolegnia diclina VS20]|eukprot:XP_008614728.1 hypothetical protein SDRG_10513 [Saprolegnia diclina VS20]